ncbi:MAG: DUF1552 domain-containing protein [Archangium sp.]|nr:DUF1552 domain-containing protein [Archangium sp.]
MNSNRFDRRKFLVGLGGATLALPMLQSLMPRSAYGQAMSPPKRLLIIYHQDGRLFGDGGTSGGMRNDWWSPAAAGALPASGAPSPMLAPLSSVRNEIVTVDGIDNLVRHLYSDSDNHIPAQKALLTCRKGVTSGGKPAAASFDYVMGQRLKAQGSSAPASVVMFGTAADYTWRANGLEVFYGANGTPPWLIAPDPAEAITELFGAPTGNKRNPNLTLRQRLSVEKKSVLDGVLDNFNSVRGRVNATDKARLDAHAQFVRDVERGLTLPTGGGGGATGGGGGATGGGGALGGGGGATGGGSTGGGTGGGATGGGATGGGSGGGVTGGGSGGGGGGVTPSMCQRPSESSVPSNLNGSGNAYLRGERDAQMMPAIIENIVQSFACDVTRVASLMFWEADDPIFPTQFTGTSPFVSANWHGEIHATPRIYDDAASRTRAQNLSASYGHYANTFATLVQRMANFIEPDGSRMLDNTLVLWVSEMGYGSVHTASNLPVVLAGMRAAFPQGQGRHVVQSRRSMGDLLAHVMRLYGGTDTTFGETGTLGSHGTVYGADLGWTGYVNANTPLHSGPINL